MPLKNEKQESNFPQGAVIGLAVAATMGLAHLFSDKSNPNWLTYAKALGCVLALFFFCALWVLREVIANGVEKGIKAASVKGQSV